MHRMEQHSCCKCIEIVGILSSIMNDQLKEHILLIFEKLGVVLETMDIVACHRMGKITELLLNF